MFFKNKAAWQGTDLYKEIDRHTYISFDVFDTLIKRDCAKPVDVFYGVETKADKEFQQDTHFAKARIQAEATARRKGHEEVTLDEIYSCLSLEISSDKVEQLKSWELEYEYELCQLNPLIKPVYDYCVKHKKKVVIISDMYLPERVIADILDKVGIHYEALFVSSSYMVTKAKGGLFTSVLKQLQIKPSDMLHIGDNKRSDYLMPKALGIAAHHIAKNECINLIIDKRKKQTSPAYAALCAFVNTHAAQHEWDALRLFSAMDFFSQVGYEAEGPLLYGYVNWLHEEFQKDGIQHAFFLARDGQLMQKAYQKLGNPIENTYMYASRKALIIPTLWMNPTISALSKCFAWNRREYFKTIVKNMGLEPADIEEQVRDAGFELNSLYVLETLWKDARFIALFENFLKEQMIKSSRQAYDLLVKYLNQIHFSGNVAIIDIGWFGNMQRALLKVAAAAKIPVTIHGYYLGLRATTSITRDANAKGYLFEPGKREDLDKKESTFNSIVEMMFTADHGSTKKYQEIEGKIAPFFSGWEYENYKSDYESIRACQKGAMAFIEDMERAKQHFTFYSDPSFAFTNLERLGCFPSERMAAGFGDLHFEDGIVSYVAKTKGNSYYVSRPKALWLDFRDSWWKAGFLTRCFGDDFPSYDCYLLLRKIRNWTRRKG